MVFKFNKGLKGTNSGCRHGPCSFNAHAPLCVCVCVYTSLYIYRHEAVLKKNKTEIIALFSCAHKQTHTHTYKAELNESIWGFHSVTL